MPSSTPVAPSSSTVPNNKKQQQSAMQLSSSDSEDDNDGPHTLASASKGPSSSSSTSKPSLPAPEWSWVGWDVPDAILKNRAAFFARANAAAANKSS